MAVTVFKHQRLRLETDKRLERIKDKIEFYEDERSDEVYRNKNGHISRDRIIREGLKCLENRGIWES
ncbi:MAG: hypothetical protein ABEJ83_04090 [Candidatus Nanohaloarchaea archaeon]